MTSDCDFTLAPQKRGVESGYKGAFKTPIPQRMIVALVRQARIIDLMWSLLLLVCLLICAYSECSWFRPPTCCYGLGGTGSGSCSMYSDVLSIRDGEHPLKMRSSVDYVATI